MRFDFRKYLRSAICAAYLGSALPAIVFAEDGNSELAPVVDALPPVVDGDTIRLTNYFMQPGAPQQPLDYNNDFLPSSPGDILGSQRGFVSTDLTGLLDTIQGLGGVGQSTPVLPPQQGSHSDLASVLKDSPVIQTVNAQQRSQIAFDPRVRAYHIGQVYAQANGELWMPVRNDLDSMLSKIDPSLVSNIQVIPGPYSAQYGPAFSVIDVTTIDTPRYANGYEAHNRIGFKPMFNGNQMYGYDTVYGGSTDYGFIFSYSNHNGNDYLAGNDTRIPSSYHAQSFLGQFGVDLSPDTKAEVRYRRLDQTNTEYPLQFFDVSFLVTDSVSATIINSDLCFGIENRLDGWYNRTKFAGDTNKAGKRPFPGNQNWHVIDRVEQAVSLNQGVPTTFAGYTNGDLTSTGARYMKTYGFQGEQQIRFGADVRYLEQHTAESFFLNPALAVNPVQTNQPRSNMTNPGIFAEWSRPVNDIFTTKAGGRVDWVTMNAQATGGLPDGLRPSNSLLVGAPGSLPSNSTLFSLYFIEELQLADRWSAQLALGHAQRPSTLTERYADGVYLSILQNGFTKVVGNPTLSPEKNYQCDLTIKTDQDFWRARATGFHSWIVDYITYDRINVSDPLGAQLVISQNTDLATLTGFELYGDVDVTPGVSVFGSAQYVRGVDQEINAPLPGIYPLEGRVGVRLTEPSETKQYGLEIGTRIVSQQNRLGALRVFNTNAVEQVESHTPGFTTTYLRGYYNFTPQFNLVAGIDNLFNRTYYEHLNLRLPAATSGAANYPAIQVLSPGISPYLAVEWTY